MADSNKEHFLTLAARFESVGLLPKGKTADLLENYDFVVQQIEDEKKASAEVADADVLSARAKKNRTPPSDAA